MRSVLRVGLLLVPLVAVIATLLLRGPGPDDPVYRQALDSLHQIALQQAALDRDVLRSHDGLLQDYDPLVSEIHALRAAARSLDRHTATDAASRAGNAELARQIDREEAAVEHFKTDNAQLQNSLAYVDLATASLGGNTADPEVALMVGRLANDLLHLTRSPSGEIERSVRIRLAGMQALVARRDSQPELKAQIEMLETHARLLSGIIPAVDRDLRAISAASTSPSWTKLSAAADARHSAEEQRATWFQAAILLTTGLLLIVLVRLALVLRRVVQQQRLRAGLERAMAGISMDLVGRLSPDAEDGMQEAVQAMGRVFGAEHALVVLQEASAGCWHWSLAGQGLAEDWPSQAFELVQASSAHDSDLVRIPDVAKLPSGELREALSQAGFAACFGAVLRHRAEPFGLFLLGSIAVQGGWVVDDGPLRMAAEIMGNAARGRVELLEHAALQQRQVRVRRLEALGTFASGIAHNFNNVIGAVLGYAEMAAEDLPPGATASRYVHEIQVAGERAQTLVSRILEFGSRGRSCPETLSVDHLLEETASMLQASLPAAASLTV